MSGGLPGTSSSRSAHARTSRASRNPPLHPVQRRRQGQGIEAAAPVAMSAKTSSSSSMSPIGTMRGSSAASTPSTSRKSSRASLQARRVGRKSWRPQSRAGRCRQALDQPAVPSAPMSAGRNGTDGGMVKTRGFMGTGRDDGIARLGHSDRRLSS